MTKSPGPAVEALPPSNPLPGFSLTLGFSIFYLTVIVLAPIAALALKALRLPWAQFWELAFNERAMDAYKLSLGASLAAALINAFFGSLLAWVLVRYRFPGRRLLDGLIDFPFALPTAVAGLTLANLFSAHGWLGRFLVPMGIQGLYPPGRHHRADVRRPAFFRPHPPAGARSTGPRRWRKRRPAWARAVCGPSSSVIAPTLLPTMLTGFGLSFARALGEYGSIVFISGNLPFKTEIAPTLIVMRLERIRLHGRHRRGAGADDLFLRPAVDLERAARMGCQIPTKHESPDLTDPTPDTPEPKRRRTRRWQDGSHRRCLAICRPFSCCCRLINVFARPSPRAWGPYWKALADPDTASAIRLTLAGGGHQRPSERGLRPGGLLGHRQVRVPRQGPFADIDRPAIFHFAGRGGLDVRPALRARGLLGPWLEAHHLKIIFALPGMVLATIFVTFPLRGAGIDSCHAGQGREQEEAALDAGRSGWKTFWHVTLPSVKWGLFYGIILCNARAMGEFGAVSVVSGHIAGQTDTLPLRVEKLYNEFDPGRPVCRRHAAGHAGPGHDRFEDFSGMEEPPGI